MISVHDIDGQGYVGETVNVILKAGGSFKFHITGYSDGSFTGFDAELTDLKIDLADIHGFMQ